MQRNIFFKQNLHAIALLFQKKGKNTVIGNILTSNLDSAYLKNKIASLWVVRSTLGFTYLDNCNTALK